MTTYADCTTKKAQVQFIREQLACNLAWATKGLKRIYEHQTAEEQNIGDTCDHNGVGFTGADGEILSSFAEQVNAGRTLSVKQRELLFKKMPKYAKQLNNLVQPKQQSMEM